MTKIPRIIPVTPPIPESSKDSDINYSEILNPELKEERKKEEQKSVETIKKAVSTNKTPDILSDKSKDLFDELFGDK